MKPPVAGLALVMALALALMLRGLGRRSLALRIDDSPRWSRLWRGLQPWARSMTNGTLAPISGDGGPAAIGKPVAAGLSLERSRLASVGAVTYPATVQQRLLLLERQFQGFGPPSEGRLAAVQAAGRWGNRACLPLLIRALRDPDLAVVLEASRAIQRFRGQTTVAVPAPSVIPLPLNAHWAPQRIQPLAPRPDPRMVARTR